MSLVIGGLFGLELVLATRPYRTLPVTTSTRTYTTIRDAIAIAEAKTFINLIVGLSIPDFDITAKASSN